MFHSDKCLEKKKMQQKSRNLFKKGIRILASAAGKTSLRRYEMENPFLAVW